MFKYHYVYRITNIKLNKHYYGVRTSKVIPNEDLGIKYFSSSTNKDFIKAQKENNENFKYKIILKFDNRELANKFEVKIHSKFNVSINENFYNKANATSSLFSTEGLNHSNEAKDKIGLFNKGKVLSDITKEKISIKRKAQKNDAWIGRKHTKQSIEKMKLVKLGKKMSIESRNKRAEAANRPWKNNNKSGMKLYYIAHIIYDNWIDSNKCSSYILKKKYNLDTEPLALVNYFIKFGNPLLDNEYILFQEGQEK